MTQHPQEMPEGMVPWYGGDSAPADWNGGEVLGRHGAWIASDGIHRWTHDGDGADIVAYTPTNSQRDVIARAILARGISGGSTFTESDREEMAYDWADAVVAALATPRADEGRTRIERECADLIARYYRLEIGVLMQQAERWAENGKPFATHHRLHKADSYFQIVSLMERDPAKGWKPPFEEIRHQLARQPLKPPGTYPPSADLHRYCDASFVAALATGAPADPRGEWTVAAALDEIAGRCAQTEWANCLRDVAQALRDAGPAPLATTPADPRVGMEADLKEARADVALWKREAADRSEGMIQLNLDRAAMGVENSKLREKLDLAREALVQADLKIRSFPGADQSDVEFIRTTLAQIAGEG